eukprot:scaffold50587_cov63-Phaeocystis_antarctica.AAC.1
MFPCKTIDGQLVRGGDWPRLLHHAAVCRCMARGCKKRLERPPNTTWEPVVREKERESGLPP